jgi:hypothetical protein
VRWPLSGTAASTSPTGRKGEVIATQGAKCIPFPMGYVNAFPERAFLPVSLLQLDTMQNPNRRDKDGGHSQTLKHQPWPAIASPKKREGN